MQAYLLLKSMMKIVRRQTLSDAMGHHFFDPKTALRETRTVKVGLPRRSGKTTALMELHAAEPSLVISAVSTSNAQQLSFEHPHANVIYIGALSNHNFPKDPISAVFVDEAFMLDVRDKMGLYEWLAVCHGRCLLSEDFVVVMIGT